METKKLSIKQNMIYNSVGTLTYLVCQWLITIVVVRLSDYENAGILSLAMSINNVLYPISTFGLRNYQVSDVDCRYSDFEYIIARGITCAFSTFCCIVFILLNFTHYSLFQAGCIFLYFLFKVTEAMIDVFQGIQQKKYRMDYVGKSFFVRGILTLIGFSVALKLTGSLAVSIIVMILGNFSVLAFYDYGKCRKLSERFGDVKWSNVKALLVENLPLMLNEVFMTSIVSIARYFLEFYKGSEVLGIYASIATPTVIVQTACNVIYSPLITEYAVHYSNKNFPAYKKLLFGVMKAFAGIMLLMVAGVYLFGEWGLQLLFGSSILEYSYLLIQTVIVMFQVVFMYWLSALMVVARRQKQVMCINGIAMVLVIILSLRFIPIWGIDGVNYILFAVYMAGIAFMGILVVITIRKNFAVDMNGHRS